MLFNKCGCLTILNKTQDCMVQVWAPEMAMCCGVLVVSCLTMLNNVNVDKDAFPFTG